MLTLNREKIKAMMLLKGWTNADLARGLGSSREWIRQVMDEEKDLRLSTIDKWAKVLGFVNPKDLII